MKAVYWVLLATVALIVACGSSTDNDLPTSTDAPISPTPTIGLNQRLELEAAVERLQAGQQTLESLWQTLQTGGNVSCQRQLDVMSLTFLPTDTDDIQLLLMQASDHLIRSNELWLVECGNPRSAVSFDVIERGLSAALAAGTILEQAIELLYFETRQ